MNAIKGPITTVLFFLTIVSMLVFQSHHLSDADMNKKDGYTCNTDALGSSRKVGNYYQWEVWSDYFAKIHSSGRKVGDSANGRIEVHAFISGGTNPPDINRNFTLKVKGWGFIKWGEVYMKHHYSVGPLQSSPTCPAACAMSGGHFGTVTAMTEKSGGNCP